MPGEWGWHEWTLNKRALPGLRFRGGQALLIPGSNPPRLETPEYTVVAVVRELPDYNVCKVEQEG